MITRFKIFENQEIEPIVKVGDYVLLDMDEMNKHNVEKMFQIDKDYPDNMFLITMLNDGIGEDTEIYGRRKQKDYVYFYHGSFYDGYKANIRKEEIIRPLTDNEIEEYETKKLAKRYNV